MEAMTTNESGEKAATNEELSWRAHVCGAAEFTGPNAEYCRRYGLDHRVFRAYKKKFGVVKSRVPERTVFVKLEPSLAAATAAPVREARNRELPDPAWTAKFIVALMEARR
jgi:hypothetical protein